jgi:hypothetical protein
VALSRHFTSDYDYEKYGGKVRLRARTFETHKDRFRFERLSRLSHPRWRMIAVLVDDEKAWIGDASGEKGDRLLPDRLSKAQAVSYVVKLELEKMRSLGLGSVMGEHPQIVRSYLAGDVSPETLSVLGCMSGAVDRWKGDPVVEMVARKAKKYHTFLEYDKSKIAKIVVDTMSVSGI